MEIASPCTVRTSVDLNGCNEQNNELYQMKVDVGMLNTVKNYWAEVSNVSPSSQQNVCIICQCDWLCQSVCLHECLLMSVWLLTVCQCLVMSVSAYMSICIYENLLMSVCLLMSECVLTWMSACQAVCLCRGTCLCQSVCLNECLLMSMAGVPLAIHVVYYS